jgi:hypothetical protein
MINPISSHDTSQHDTKILISNNQASNQQAKPYISPANAMATQDIPQINLPRYSDVVQDIAVHSDDDNSRNSN